MEADRASTQCSARSDRGQGCRAEDESTYRLEYVDVPARVEQLPTLRHALVDWARRHGVGDEQIDAMTLATYEALANVVEHAYPDAEGKLDLRACYLLYERRVEISVTDHGHWQPAAADPGPLSGRGLPLMRQLADTVHVEPDPQGTTIRLHWITSGPC